MLSKPNITLGLCLALLTLTACTKTPQELLARGKERLHNKDYRRAIIDFKNAAKKLPKDPEPRYQLGLAYLEIGDLNTAVGNLQEAIRINPAHTDAQLKLAQLMALDQDLSVVREAEKRAQAVLASSQGNAEAIATLAMVEMRLGEKDDAETRLRNALLKFPKHLHSSILLATIKLQNRDFPAAEGVLKMATAQDPKSPEAWLALGELYILMGRFADAESNITRSLQLSPNNVTALADLTEVLLQAGRAAEAEKTCKRLSETGDPNFKAAYGLFLFQQHREQDAINEFARLAKADPADRDARTRLVSAYLATKHTAEAEAILTAALKKNPKDVDALLQRSQIYLLAGKYGSAEIDLNQVFSFRPDSADAHYVLARVFQAQGASQNQRRELSESLKLDPNLLPARIDLAQSLIGANDARAALDLMTAVPPSQKKAIPALVQKNWALWALGQLDDLRASLQEALAIAKTPDLMLQDALLKLRQNDAPGARAELEAVLKQNPEELRALETLARSYAGSNQAAIATAKVREYAAAHPKSAPLQQFLGSWLISTGDKDGARKAFEEAKAADPASLPANFALAQLDLVDHRVDAARGRLSSILSTNQTNVDARVLLGMVEELAGNYDQAIEDYRKVIEVEGNNLFALNNLAYRLAVAGKTPDEALKYAQRAFELNPNNPAVEDTLGWALYSKGLYSSALEHLKSAVDKDPAPIRMYHLAMVYMKNGDQAHARQVYNVAYKANPTLPEAKTVGSMLSGVQIAQ